MGPPFSERCIEDDLPAYADLVSGHASFEEVGDFLNVLQIHERERVLCSVSLLETERGEPLIGAELQIAAHVREGHPDHARAEEILGELRLARDRLLEHV